MGYTYYLYLVRLANRNVGKPEFYWAYHQQIMKVRKVCGLDEPFRPVDPSA